MYGQGSLLTSRNMWSEQGPAASLNCPAVLVLEFPSIENESPIALLWGAHLPLAFQQSPQSNFRTFASPCKDPLLPVPFRHPR